MADVSNKSEALPLEAGKYPGLVEVETKLARTPLVAIFEEKAIRILGTVEDPLFCAVDVATHIEDLHHYMRSISKYTLGEYVQKLKAADTAGRVQLMIFLTEAGLYKYLLQARGEKAEEFQRFVYKLLKEERKRTVDGVQLALKISQTQLKQTQAQLKVSKQEQLAMCRAANEARDRCAQLAEENAKFRRQKEAAEDATFMRSMGRGHLIQEPQEKWSGISEEESEQSEQENNEV